jgi:ATP-dependent DNA helicase DinG
MTLKNFPFATLREKQSLVLKEIDAAFASGCKYILLEAPTGFGKSPVAIAVALTLGTSYTCTSTKDLQTQYARDFPFLTVAKGKNNFIFAVKEDLIRNGTHKCGSCLSNECHHTSADYGPCINNKSFKDDGCKYGTFQTDYQIQNKGSYSIETSRFTWISEYGSSVNKLSISFYQHSPHLELLSIFPFSSRTATCR